MKITENWRRGKPTILRPVGDGADDFVQIGDAPFRAVADQGNAPLNGGGVLRTAGGLSCQGHAPPRFPPFHFAERHGFHGTKFYRSGLERQARWLAHIEGSIPRMRLKKCPLGTLREVKGGLITA